MTPTGNQPNQPEQAHDTQYAFSYAADQLDGLEVRASLRMNPLHTALVHLIENEQRPLVTVELTNHTDTSLNLQVQVQAKGYSHEVSQMAPLAPGATISLDLFPAFRVDQVATVEQLTRATLHVRVRDLGEDRTRLGEDLPLQLLALNSAPLTVRDPATDQWLDQTRYFGAFVTPHDSELNAFLNKAAAFLPAGHVFNGYQVQDVTPQVQALYEALAARETVYVDSTLDFNPADATQQTQSVRLPKQVLTLRTANCIDGTLLMASLLERIGIEPAIIVLPAHALLGWAPYAGAGDWSYLETTQIGHKSFQEAQEVGKRRVEPKIRRREETGNDAFYRCWPLRDLRKQGITPITQVKGDELGRIARALEAKTQPHKPVPADQPSEAGESPYKGLQYFDVGDADRFFGRERLTAQLVGYLRGHRFLAVIGASGSGKSSVVRAGVVPALASGNELVDGSLPPKGSRDWLVHILTPTAHPLKTLSASLTKGSESVTAQATLIDDMSKDARSVDLYVSRLLADVTADHLLLVVDQFEELFTLCKDRDDRKVFVDNLLTAAQPDGPTTVIITLRADFYHRCAEFDDLRMALANGQTYSDGKSWIEDMSDDEFREAIEKPAALGDWGFEPGLVDVMLKAVEHEPGALPLLSHALLETWNNRRGRTMTFAGYYAAGGVKGAIATRADTEFNDLDADEQVVARNIFVRLTELGEGSEDTRRRVSREELLGTGKDAETVTKVLTTLGYARLITVDQDEVEVAHEALIREWPTLRAWLEDDRDELRTHRRLMEMAEAWDDAGRKADDLDRGTRLEQTVEWAEVNPGALNDLERDFLDASMEQVAAGRREKEATQKRERNRTRLALAAVLIAFLLAVAVAWILYQQNQDLQGERALTAAFTLQDHIQESTDANTIRDKINLAKEEIDAAIVADPSLKDRIGVNTFITDTLRIAATQLVQEGERLAVADDHMGAHTQFETALALNERFEDYAVPPEAPFYIWIEGVEGDEFMMGTGPDDELASSDEKSQHPVPLDGYWILRTEVTNAQYARCVDTSDCTPPENTFWNNAQNLNQPVTHVDWKQANEYAEFVGGRLPTEAQWELACRSTDGRVYPWENDVLPDATFLNFDHNVGSTTNVGSYPSGANELYDMAGNVWEWTSSLYSPYPYAPEDGRENSDADGRRTLRGGAWDNAGISVRCAHRGDNYPHVSNTNIGFRVVSSGAVGR